MAAGFLHLGKGKCIGGTDVRHLSQHIAGEDLHKINTTVPGKLYQWKLWLSGN